ncbi:hypothetical protein EVAR_86631_1 [Eumeta japonica]|uniref:Uncharacterized protein n=1 Tax=Eumeta variegata TaxID=151549 RepID=A0A4C1Z6K0_EUMVA|nr:hypothetical protein EVAR_86631_1 [Eumeta japonica]
MREKCKAHGHTLSIKMYITHTCRRMRHLQIAAELHSSHSSRVSEVWDSERIWASIQRESTVSHERSSRVFTPVYCPFARRFRCAPAGLRSTTDCILTNQTSPNSIGLRRLITEFLWPPSSSIIRPWLPYSIKVLVKTNQTSPNSMGLRRLITEFLWPPSSSIIRPWLPYSIKVLVKTNQTSPNSMGLRRLITELLWPPSSSIIRR